MKIVALCVRDVRANCFFNPLFVQSVGQGLRQFEDEISRAADDNLLYKHPEDFELYQLGTFDTETATFELLRSPLQIAVGSSCVREALAAAGVRGNGKADRLGLDSVRPV